MKYYDLTEAIPNLKHCKLYINNTLVDAEEYFFRNITISSTREELEEIKHRLWCAEMEVQCKKEGMDLYIKSAKYSERSPKIPLSVRLAKVTELQKEKEKLEYSLEHLTELQWQGSIDPYMEVPSDHVVVVSSTKIYIVVETFNSISVTEIPISDLKL